MPFVDESKKLVHIEPYNLGRFAVECSKAGHRTITIYGNTRTGKVAPSVFTIVSGVPFEEAADIAKRLPSRRDESHSDKPDDKDSEGKGP